MDETRLRGEFEFNYQTLSIMDFWLLWNFKQSEKERKHEDFFIISKTINNNGISNEMEKSNLIESQTNSFL